MVIHRDKKMCFANNTADFFVTQIVAVTKKLALKLILEKLYKNLRSQ
jgi:hypothetical protein